MNMIVNDRFVFVIQPRPIDGFCNLPGVSWNAGALRSQTHELMAKVNCHKVRNEQSQVV